MMPQLKLGSGIDDLVSGVPKVEEVRKIYTDFSSDLSKVFKVYEKILDFYYFSILCEHEDIGSRIKHTTPLTPEQINAFLQTTINYENHDNYVHNTGLFITALIKKSYTVGHNDFYLNTENLKALNNIGFELRGTKKRQLKLNIQGNIGYNCGRHSRNSSFVIQGDTGDHCGYDSKNSSFTIHGNTGDMFGAGSEVFKTSNKATLQIMLENVPEGNKIIFINPDGTERRVK